MHQVLAGEAYPLGATPSDEGTNFAIFSANATRVELCLFDASGENEIQRICLPKRSDNIWHGYIQGINPGTLYGYRIDGPYKPKKGHRFNPNKLLIDPYAKQLSGNVIWSDTHLAYDSTCTKQDLTIDKRDNSKYMPKCIVIDSNALKKNITTDKYYIDASKTIVYEMHVKGFTQLNPDIPVELRGTFKGLGTSTVTDYLIGLGVTSVELLPVHAFVNEPSLSEKGMVNYWGYNSLSFFAPQPGFLHNNQLVESQNLVNNFHEAGIEIILDVVFNHTCEGDQLGPTYCYKGIDNASYYRLVKNDLRYYKNYSGCGNTLNLQHPRVLQLVMDSLRYWVDVMGVDGFRFDLATTLGRGRRDKDDFVDYSSFFATIRQDPVLAKTRFIAEPWDIGPNGYQLGNFPDTWMEWNDRFRDTVRRFWRGDCGMLPELARRLHGSYDIFSKKDRHPYSSINYVTSHDGFTLEDLVSYEQSHNIANGEKNRDGHAENFSANYGAEGKTDNKSIRQLRAQQKRNILTTMLFSQGTPMLLSGDEFGNSQDGNNNAYCQDNETTWLDWSAFDLDDNKKLFAFVRKLLKLRKEHPLLNRNNFQHGEQYSEKTGLPDISWYSNTGKEMQAKHWHNQDLKCFSMLLGDVGEIITLSENILFSNQYCSIEYGKNEALLIILNANTVDEHFVCPDLEGQWKIIIDTSADHFVEGASEQLQASRQLQIAAQSCLVLTFTQSNL